MHILFTNGSVLPLKVFRSKYQDFRAANVKKFPTKSSPSYNSSLSSPFLIFYKSIVRFTSRNARLFFHPFNYRHL